jgi:hypothetical protein
MFPPCQLERLEWFGVFDMFGFDVVVAAVQSKSSSSFVVVDVRTIIDRIVGILRRSFLMNTVVLLIEYYW